MALKKNLIAEYDKKYENCHSICYTPGELIHKKVIEYMVENGYTTRQPVIDIFVREGLKKNGIW